MDQAKAAVNKIIGRSGHHDTEVDEHVRPAVTEEVVKPHRHEETTQAIDREVHQDHYHTTVQPLEHREVQPERHSHQMMPVQEREITHGDHDRIRSSVDAEAAKFGNTSTTHQTTHSTSQAPVAAGEHVHHHVHETVQPVIHKESVRPEVVHTTVPIHETHHAQAEHHGLSTLPTKTLDEFKELGGKITGASHRHEEYEGHPRPYNPAMQQTQSDADRRPAQHDGIHDHHGTSGTSLTGTTGTTGGLTGATGTTGGLTGTHGTHGGLTGTTGTTGTHGGLGGTTSNVSGIGSNVHTGSGLTSGSTGVGSSGVTGTALGGRTEGNTVGRAVDAAASHGTTGVGSTHSGPGVGAGTTGTDIGSSGHLGRGVGHTATSDLGSTGVGSTTHHDRGHADTLSSTNTGNTGSTRAVDSDVQTPQQGKDPSLLETEQKGPNWRGEGADGSHSAVFGLTPDGHKHDDTAHGQGALRPAHTKSVDPSAERDMGSRAPTGSSVANQLNDPRVLEKGHGGPNLTSDTSAKPGAGATFGGEQGLGQVRPQDHGAEDKIKNKLDPTTDSDRDGKRGVMD